MIYKTFLLIIFLSSLIAHFTNGVDEDELKDIKCIYPHPAVARNVDYKWLLSINRHYIPLQSQLNYYRMASSLLELPISEITESDLNSSCITYKWGDPSPKVFGFENKTVTYVTTPIYENSFGFKGTWAKDKRARAYITLKEDTNFVFFTNCWEDDQASWAVISKTKTLDPSLTESIMEHVKSLGFNQESIFNQTYQGCPDIVNEHRNSSYKNEL